MVDEYDMNEYQITASTHLISSETHQSCLYNINKFLYCQTETFSDIVERLPQTIYATARHCI